MKRGKSMAITVIVRDIIGYRTDTSDNHALYVEALPGQGGCDYSYNTRIEKCLLLSLSEAAEFLKYGDGLGKATAFHTIQFQQ